MTERKCESCGSVIAGKRFEDLTKVDCAFSELDVYTQARLKALPDDAVENSDYGTVWDMGKPCWHKNLIYRQSPTWPGPESECLPKPEGVVESGGKRWRVKGDKPFDARHGGGEMYFSSNTMVVGSTISIDTPFWVWLAEEVPEEQPPRPSDDWLAEHGVRIVGDGPRLPKKGERYADTVEDYNLVVEASQDYTRKIALINTLDHYSSMWIVEPIPAPEPAAGWVECEVFSRRNIVSRRWWFRAPGGHAMTLDSALGMVGFGGILYENAEGLSWSMYPALIDGNGDTCSWSEDSDTDHRPATPLKVRFWVENQEGAAQ